MPQLNISKLPSVAWEEEKKIWLVKFYICHSEKSWHHNWGVTLGMVLKNNVQPESFCGDNNVTAGWAVSPRHVLLVSGRRGPTRLLSAKTRRRPTLPLHAPRTQNNKWVIGHKVSGSPNPLLISLWGLRQCSGCSAELAAGGGMAVVTGRQAVQAWGCLLGSKQRKYNNHTLPPLFALHLSGI